MSTRNYSHITKFDIENGIKYHVTIDQIGQLNSLSGIVVDMENNLAEVNNDLIEIRNIQTEMEALSSLTIAIPETPVAAVENKLVDSFTPTTEFFACDWNLSVINAASNNAVSILIKAVWNYSTPRGGPPSSRSISVNQTLSTSVGDVHDITFAVALISDVISLRVVNTGASTWSVRGRRTFI